MGDVPPNASEPKTLAERREAAAQAMRVAINLITSTIEPSIISGGSGAAREPISELKYPGKTRGLSTIFQLLWVALVAAGLHGEGVYIFLLSSTDIWAITPSLVMDDGWTTGSKTNGIPIEWLLQLRDLLAHGLQALTSLIERMAHENKTAKIAVGGTPPGTTGAQTQGPTVPTAPAHAPNEGTSDELDQMLEDLLKLPAGSSANERKALLTAMARARRGNGGTEAACAIRGRADGTDPEKYTILPGKPPTLNDTLPETRRKKRASKLQVRNGSKGLELVEESESGYYMLTIVDVMYAYDVLSRTYYIEHQEELAELRSYVTQMWDKMSNGTPYAPALLRLEYAQRVKHSEDPEFAMGTPSAIAITNLVLRSVASGHLLAPQGETEPSDNGEDDAGTARPMGRGRGQGGGGRQGGGGNARGAGNPPASKRKAPPKDEGGPSHRGVQCNGFNTPDGCRHAAQGGTCRFLHKCTKCGEVRRQTVARCMGKGCA
jgi:hypothetical protein